MEGLEDGKQGETGAGCVGDAGKEGGVEGFSKCPSSETQGQIVGRGKVGRGEKKVGEEKCQKVGEIGINHTKLRNFLHSKRRKRAGTRT